MVLIPFSDLSASWLVCLTPDWVIQVQALAGGYCVMWARHFTLTVPLFSQVYKWVPVMLGGLTL